MGHNGYYERVFAERFELRLSLKSSEMLSKALIISQMIINFLLSPFISDYLDLSPKCSDYLAFTPLIRNYFSDCKVNHFTPKSKQIDIINNI